MLLLTLGTVLLAGFVARDHALAEARTRTVGIATTLAAPMVNEAVRRHEPAALERLDTVLRHRMGDHVFEHIKMWAPNGEVIWSDETSMIGRTYSLNPHIKALFRNRRASATVSDLSKPENAAEKEAQLLEVYVGTADADGRPFVFEGYVSTDTLHEEEKALVLSFLPLMLGGLLLFLATVLPLAVSLARRVQHSQSERAKMMRHALLASDLERRRIAQDLHDGVVQNLAGLSYAMPTVEAKLAERPDLVGALEVVQRASSLLQRDVMALRTMMTEVYPPDLKGEGLLSAVQDLALGCSDAGVEVSVRTNPDVDLDLDAARLAYRVVREGLRNVVKHAEASTATVELCCVDDQVTVRVTDDGRGLAPDHMTPEGHVGLRLLADTLTDFGGLLGLGPAATGGTALTAKFPASLVSF